MKYFVVIMAMIAFVFATNSQIAQAADRCVNECINKHCKIKFYFPIEYANCVDGCKTLCNNIPQLDASDCASSCAYSKSKFNNVNIGMSILSLFYYILVDIKLILLEVLI